MHRVPLIVFFVALEYGVPDWQKIWGVAGHVAVLTSGNEALMVITSLGGPDWISKMRRLYSFGIVSALFTTEIHGYMISMIGHWTSQVCMVSQRACIVSYLSQQSALAMIVCHFQLLK